MTQQQLLADVGRTNKEDKKKKKTVNEKEWGRKRKSKRHRGNKEKFRERETGKKREKREHTTPNFPDSMRQQPGWALWRRPRQAGGWASASSRSQASDQDPLQQLRARPLERDPSLGLAG